MTESTAVAMPRLSAHAARRRTSAHATRVAKPVRDRPDAVLWALGLMHLVYAWRLPSLFPALKPLKLGMVSGVLALGLFLLDRSPRRRLADLPAGPVRFLAGLLAVMVLSVPGGIVPSHSAAFLVQTILPTMLLLVMVAASVRSLADVEWFAALNMMAAAGYCLFCLWAFQVDENGRLAELIFYDTNDLGLLIVATMPFVAYFLARGHRTSRRLLAVFCAPVFLLLLVKTGSRGAFLGLIVITAYLASYYRGVSRVTRLGTVAFVASAFMVLGGAAYFDKIATLLNPTQDYNWQGNSPTGRLEIWKRGLGYLADHPLVGVGVNNFSSAEGRLSTIAREMQSRGKGFKWSAAHNSYLETATDAGVGALACFLGLFAATFLKLRDVTRVTGRLPFVSRELVLAQVFTASLIGYLVCAFFISAEYFVYPYVLLGLSMGFAKAALPRAQVVP